MKKRKEFAALKWLIFPSMSLTLAAIVSWFNVTIFGWRDGAFYVAAVAIIAAFSIAINKYVGADNMRLAVAAFVFELLLILVLGANAIYSLSVQREMSVARQSEQTNIEAIREIKQLKSRTAQRDATRMVAADKKDAKSSQAVFAEHERVLLYLMAAEMLAYVVSAFTLLGLSHLWRPKAEDADEFPDELEVRNRVPVKRENFTAQKDSRVFDAAKTLESFNPEGLKILREVLRDISFRLAGYSFKSHVKDDAVWVRMMKAVRGTQETAYSAKCKLSILADAVRMPRDKFRERLERFLIQNGFPIE